MYKDGLYEDRLIIDGEIKGKYARLVGTICDIKIVKDFAMATGWMKKCGKKQIQMQQV